MTTCRDLILAYLRERPKELVPESELVSELRENIVAVEEAAKRLADDGLVDRERVNMRWYVRLATVFDDEDTPTPRSRPNVEAMFPAIPIEKAETQDAPPALSAASRLLLTKYSEVLEERRQVDNRLRQLEAELRRKGLR